jgi:hypothetical protein
MFAASQKDSNVTRQRLDPLWQAMIDQVERGLFDFRSGLLPSRIKEIERQTGRRYSFPPTRRPLTPATRRPRTRTSISVLVDYEAVYNVFNVQRHLISRATRHRFRAAAHHAWNDATAIA